MNVYFILTCAMLAGTIMGAGIFSLPFVVHAIGFWVGVAYLIFFAGIYLAIHLMYAHILNDEHGRHELPYVAGRYLGPTIGRVTSIMVLMELFFVLTAYLALAPSFITIIFGTTPVFVLVLYWVISSFFVFASLRIVEITNLLGTLMFVGVVGTVYYFGIGEGGVSMNIPSVSWTTYLMPFGPLFFAMSGAPSIYKVVEAWREARAIKKPFSLYGAVAVGTLIPVGIYIAFVMGVLGLNATPSSDALSGLMNVLPHSVYIALGIMGIVAIWKSYFMIGANIRVILRRDIHISNIMSAILILLVPPLFYILGAREFLWIIGLIGGVFAAFAGAIVVAVWRKKYHTHHLYNASLLLYVIFTLAIIYELIHIFS